MHKRNKIAILLILILGSISVWFVFHTDKSTLRKGLRNFALEDTSRVTKLFLADKNAHTITLVKMKPGEWKLNDKYYARNDAVITLLGTMKSMDVKYPVAKMGQERIFRMLATMGTKVEAYEGDKLVKLFYVGTETPDFLGTYMLLADPETGKNSTVPYVVYIPGFDGYLTPRFLTGEDDWRDRTIFRFIPPEIKSIQVEFPEKAQDGFEITNLPGTKFEVRSLKEKLAFEHIDTMAVMQYVSYFQNIQFELIEKVSKNYRDSVVSSNPMCIIRLIDLKGNLNSVKLFYRNPPPGAIDSKGNPSKYDPDRIFALINNGKDFVTAQFYVFGKLIQPAAYFTSKNIVKR